MRFKDLLGRSGKSHQESATGRLLTTPDVAAAEPRPLPAPPPPRPTTELPVADAFERLLAAEQGEAELPSVPAPAAPPAVLSDADVDRIARRVGERLAESPLADDLRRIVSEVSERLVREEIDRIRKAAEAREP